MITYILIIVFIILLIFSMVLIKFNKMKNNILNEKLYEFTNMDFNLNEEEIIEELNEEEIIEELNEEEIIEELNEEEINNNILYTDYEII